jgi:hypothetical protein
MEVFIMPTPMSVRVRIGSGSPREMRKTGFEVDEHARLNVCVV